MHNGYWGKLLRVDLHDGSLRDEAVPERVWQEYLGGTGLAAKYIRDEVPATVAPLDPANRLMFVTGPYQMTMIPGCGRWEVCSISPLTGRWGEANGGGFFGVKLKRTGYDGIIIQGRADRPLYLSIDERGASLHDAAKLWGLDAIQTGEELEKLHGQGSSAVTIGPAGEHQAPLACVLSDKAHGVAGRTGMGAVMGAKNLKAIVVKGNKTRAAADQETLDHLINHMRQTVRGNDFAQVFRQHGEPICIVPREENGLLPLKNWAQGSWKEGAAKLGTPYYTEVLKVKPKACAFCPVGCHRHVTVADGGPYDHEGPGAEYETLGMIGSVLLIDDVKKVSYANNLLNRYGLDTISTGGVLGFVFECFEKGLLTVNDLDGIAARWGDADALIALIHKMGRNEGIGRELVKGVRHMARLVGHGSEAWAIEVNGLEIPAHDPRAFTSMGVTYATGPRGACHLHGLTEEFESGLMIPEIGLAESQDRFANTPEKGLAAARYQDWAALFNSLIQCIIYPFFGTATVTDQVNLLNALNGWNLTPREFLAIGERISTVQHLINLDRGLTPADMRLPQRLYEPLASGGTAGHVPDLDVQLPAYFAARGWDEHAVPTPAKLAELHLG